MKHNRKYEDFVMETVRQQRTPRTLDEAYQDGEYGYSIHLAKSDFKQAMQFGGGAVVGFLIVASVFFSVYGLVVLYK